MNTNIGSVFTIQLIQEYMSINKMNHLFTFLTSSSVAVDCIPKVLYRSFLPDLLNATFAYKYNYIVIKCDTIIKCFDICNNICLIVIALQR